MTSHDRWIVRGWTLVKDWLFSEPNTSQPSVSALQRSLEPRLMPSRRRDETLESDPPFRCVRRH
jgi:hypothetical protein